MSRADNLAAQDKTVHDFVLDGEITEAEMSAGSADGHKWFSLRRLRFGFLASLTPNGYIVFPAWMGGLIIQWGFYTASPTQSLVSFPMAFPNAVLMKPIFGSENATSSAEVPAWQPGSVNNSGFRQISTVVHPASYLVIGN